LVQRFTLALRDMFVALGLCLEAHATTKAFEEFQNDFFLHSDIRFTLAILLVFIQIALPREFTPTG
jgi:hypothetical protein